MLRPDSTVFKWAGAIVLTLSIMGTGVTVYLSYKHLWERLDAEAAGDAVWIKTDRSESAAILAALEDVKDRLVILNTRLDTDAALLYRIGLADGAALCRE